VNPLDRFRMVETAGGQHLEFEDLAVRHGFAQPAGTWYYYALHPAHKRKNSTPVRSMRGSRILLSDLAGWARNAHPQSSLFVLTIGTRRDGGEFPDRIVTVYLEREGTRFQLRGWEH